MADFARVATRIGHGLGEEMRSLTDEAISRIRLSQNRFATEEDVLTTLLKFWLTRHKPVVDGSMDLGSVANEGRPVTTAELLPELNAIAREFDLRFQAGTPESLGRRIRNMEAALAQVFEIASNHGKKQDDCKVSELDRRGGRWSALGGRRKSWLAGAWISGLETILPGAGRSDRC